MFLLGPSWIPKISSLLTLTGTSLAVINPTAGVVIIGIGCTIGLFAARQNNKSSEQAGAGVIPIPYIKEFLRKEALRKPIK